MTQIPSCYLAMPAAAIRMAGISVDGPVICRPLCRMASVQSGQSCLGDGEKTSDRPGRQPRPEERASMPWQPTAKRPEGLQDTALRRRFHASWLHVWNRDGEIPERREDEVRVW